MGKQAIWATAMAMMLAACAAGGAAVPAMAPLPQAQTQDAYFQAAAARAETAGPLQGRPARNVILFVGDGMGVATTTAARIYAGQLKGQDGESFVTAMDRFPHTALSRTYSHDFQISDSAATATAMTSGVKTNSGAINVLAAPGKRRCAEVAGAETTTLFALAEGRGLATGIVSTARITHATPAAAFAVSADRNWEADADLPEGPENAACRDIARQLVEWPAGDGFEVVLGGGRTMFLPETKADPEEKDEKGRRKDGRDLTADWAARSAQHAYVWDLAGFQGVDFNSDVKTLGLFSASHMAYEADRAGDAGGEPSLAEMTVAAITRLARDADGYVLMVEGGRIDHAHHGGEARRALADALAMDNAIAKALEMTDREDTLIIVTADHSHTLTIAGYAPRGTPILGLSGGAEGPAKGADGKPYTTLGYVNGPGAVDGPRADLSAVDVEALGFRQQAVVPMRSETHAGEDVVIYAWGPGDELFAGTLEQNVIFHGMARALGWPLR